MTPLNPRLVFLINRRAENEGENCHLPDEIMTSGTASIPSLISAGIVMTFGRCL
jgi:hypothetical protein